MPDSRQLLHHSATEVGPVDPMPTEPRIYTCYPLITFFAMTDAEAAEKLNNLDAYINGLDGVSTELTEECYRVGFKNETDEPWDVPDAA